MIHIGLPKTATTFFQESIFPYLSNVRYISRPYTQANNAFNKLQYADDSLYNSYELQDEIDKILSLEPKHNTVLISDELFCGLSHYNFINRSLIAHRLASILPNAEVILFLRGQKDIIRSLYNQKIKIGWLTDRLSSKFISIPGKGLNLEDWLNGRRDWDMNLRYINHRSYMNQHHFLYYDLVKFYKNIFRVHVFLYEDFITKPQAFVKEILYLLESDLPEEKIINIIKKVNSSLTDERMLSKMIQNRLTNLTDKTRGKLGQTIANLILSILDSNKILKEDEEYLNQLVNQELYAQNNLMLEQKYPEIGVSRYPDAYPLPQ